MGDETIKYTERMTGALHATLPDTLKEEGINIESIEKGSYKFS